MAVTNMVVAMLSAVPISQVKTRMVQDPAYALNGKWAQLQQWSNSPPSNQ